MPTRRDTLAFGASAIAGVLAGAGRASASAETGQVPALQTGLFNFNQAASRDTQSEIVSRLKSFATFPGIDGVLVGQNFIPTQFPTRFEWMYMVQPGDLRAAEARATYAEFDRVTKELALHCSSFVECQLRSPFPAKFAVGAGVKVRHTVMFDFKPDAPVAARERNIAAIRSMGALPMVQRYFVERASGERLGQDQLEWQVIGDFGSVEDYEAYSRAPVHLAIREDFTTHTARVAFLDVEL